MADIIREDRVYLRDFTDGYTQESVPEAGYTSFGGFAFDDMFEAFEQQNHGLVGGARTVDDFTPDGLGWANPVPENPNPEAPAGSSGKKKLLLKSP